MSSREPMWYCHECNAEMRPLMMPDPHCASCQGTFVEKMENPADDPREFSHGLGDEGFGGIPDYLEQMFSMPPPGVNPSMFGGPRGPTRSPTGGLGGSTRSRSPGSTPPGSGFRFEMHRGPGGGSSTFIIGGAPTLGRTPGTRPGGPGVDPVPNMSDYIRRNEGPTRDGEIQGQLMMQFLQMLRAASGNRAGGEDPFAALFGGMAGGPDGRMGDYVFSQEALDRIVTQLMEAGNTHRPVPATEEVIAKLDTDVLQEKSPLLEKDCAVCKEQFSLQTEDPDEQIVVTLPCHHPFHQPCIIPWLKSSGTCPVCRFALVPQPDQQASGSQPPGGSGGPSQGGSGTSGSPPRSPPPPSGSGPAPGAGSSSGGGGGGFLSNIFGHLNPLGGHGSSHSPPSTNNSRGPSNRNSTRRSTRGPSGDDVPGSWHDFLD
ncbi:hypothetical protein JAAARDRAFT_202565 [Jaapia argillacea MUCL 33604]|uniref:RING-type domain-containing protein n=1 Tax=Jaapia argillacea MUCL 33604 TaxID=933084 RepID=A0A067QK98_9AGAM|nr:hypothetical protein JAAARDRAFT_202565 [Jaapia argillacea MUCL 33604]